VDNFPSHNVVSATITRHNGTMSKITSWTEYTDEEIVERWDCYCSGNQECQVCRAFIRIMEREEGICYCDGIGECHVRYDDEE